MGKGEIARYEQFLIFPQCFQKACLPGVSKGVIVWEWVNDKALRKHPGKRRKRIHFSITQCVFYLSIFFVIFNFPSPNYFQHRRVKKMFFGKDDLRKKKKYNSSIFNSFVVNKICVPKPFTTLSQLLINLRKKVFKTNKPSPPSSVGSLHTGLQKRRSLVRSHVRPKFFPRIDDSHCGRIH